MNDTDKANRPPDVLPDDYQMHIDGADETLEEKMKRLDNWLEIVNSKIFNKPIF